jgi:hypothetical protein
VEEFIGAALDQRKVLNAKTVHSIFSEWEACCVSGRQAESVSGSLGRPAGQPTSWLSGRAAVRGQAGAVQGQAGEGDLEPCVV